MTNDLLAQWLTLFPPGAVTIFDEEGGEVTNIFYLPAGGLCHHPEHVEIPEDCPPTVLLNPSGLYPSRFKLLRGEKKSLAIHDGSFVVVDGEKIEHHQYLPQDEAVVSAYFAHLWYFEKFAGLPMFMSAWGAYRVIVRENCLIFFDYDLDKCNAVYSIDLPI